MIVHAEHVCVVIVCSREIEREGRKRGESVREGEIELGEGARE